MKTRKRKKAPNVKTEKITMRCTSEVYKTIYKLKEENNCKNMNEILEILLNNYDKVRKEGK